jgi:hypothetical protein
LRSDWTRYSPSIKPWRARKKSCTPFVACASVIWFGSVGLSADVPLAIDVKASVAKPVPPMPLLTSVTAIVELTILPDAGLNGVR